MLRGQNNGIVGSTPFSQIGSFDTGTSCFYVENSYTFTALFEPQNISPPTQIQVPNNPSHFNKEVDITIIPKQAAETKKTKASGFVKKWAGVLSEKGVEDVLLK